MKKPEFTDEQENTVFLFRLFFLLSVLVKVLKLKLCPFMNITVYIIPVCYFFLLWTAVRVAAKGTDAPVMSVLIFGILFIAGGTVFDLSATIINSPDLKREGNEYIRLLLDSGHSLTFTYFYLFLVLIIINGLDIALLTAILKNRSLAVSNKNIYFRLFWIIALLNIYSDIDHWMYGMGWCGIAISHITEITVRKICFCFCLGVCIALLWKSYRRLYQPELKAGFRLCIVSAVPVYIFIVTASILSDVRGQVNEDMLTYFDDNINYVVENNLMDKYAEIDDTIQIITSNPYIGKKQTNGADALWEYCSYNSEERREEFVGRIKKTSEMLEFGERLKPDDRLAATVDSFSTEIVDKAWMYNVLYFIEKSFPNYDGGRTVLFNEHGFPYLKIYCYYSEIMAVRIYRLHRQGKNKMAKELYLKTLHLSWILFNGDSFLSQVAGLRVLQNLSHGEIIGLGIFSEYEKKHLIRLKENMLFILNKNDTGIAYNCFKPMILINPVIFYFPDRYNKVITVLETHRDRKFIIPIYYEMLYAKEIQCIIDGSSGILFPLSDDKHLKKMIKIYNIAEKPILKKVFRQTENNIKNRKSASYDPTKLIRDSKLRFILKFASERRCKVLLWYLRPFVWNELM